MLLHEGMGTHALISHICEFLSLVNKTSARPRSVPNLTSSGLTPGAQFQLS